ncbi:MAG: diacylglycerol kinase family protein [candidate division KSB1 bacterium]|nr:diacylglycerol kinase family protein [candidate division KSB1 bacterium]
MIKIIVAGNGTVGRNWPGIKQILDRNLEEYSFEFTTGPLAAVELTRKALWDGYQTLVSMGGDGTVNEVINGFFDNDNMINPEAVLGIISMGTG